MKFFILYLSVISLFASCSNNTKSEPEIDYSNFSDKTLFLKGVNADYEQKDTLCSISLKIPTRLDTFYQWQDYTDYYDGTFTKYRFSDKRFVQYAESGFIHSIQPDSVYQLTLFHKRRKEIPDSINLKPISKEDLNNDWFFGVWKTSGNEQAEKYLKKEFRNINNRTFILSAYTAPSLITWKPSLFLFGVTRLKDREIFFVGECSAKDTVGFVDAMYKSILSIRINER